MLLLLCTSCGLWNKYPMLCPKEQHFTYLVKVVKPDTFKKKSIEVLATLSLTHILIHSILLVEISHESHQIM